MKKANPLPRKIFIGSRMRFTLLALLITACCSPATAFFVPAAFAGLANLRTVKATTPASGSNSLRGGCPATTMSVTVPTLFDVPVSNNGARCRIIIYKKGLTESDVAIKSPMDIGGLKGPEFLALNPQGLMPLLATPDMGNIPESDTIARHLLDRFSAKEPSFVPSTLAGRAKSDTISRLHDMYLTTIQGSLYKAVPPFGKFTMRSAAIADLKKQLHVIDSHIDEAGPYLCGSEVALADATLFPTMVFMQIMMPKFLAKDEKWDQAAVFGARLNKWFEWVKVNDATFTKVYDEVAGALKGWEDSGRWDTIHLAGKRDTEPDTIFDKILAGEIPSTPVYQDEHCFVFNDISPQAPTHLLVIPKKREGLTQLRYATDDHKAILGHMMVAVANVVKELKLEGYRLVINDGKDAQQTVFHLHMHILSGRAFTWPPG